MAVKKKRTTTRSGVALRRAEERCRAMELVARALTGVGDLDTLLQLVASQVTKLMEADRTSIFLMDRNSGQLWSKVAEGEGMKEIRLELGKGVAGWVAKSGKALNLKDAYRDERFNPEIDRISGYHTGSLLSVPLRGKQGDVLGVVQTLNKREGYFTTEDEALLQAICSQVAVAIENTQLVLNLLGRNMELQDARQALSRKVEELDVLFLLEREVASSLDIDQMLERLLHRTVELVDCEAGSVVLLEKQSQQLIFAGAVGTRAEKVRRLRLPRGSGVAGWVAEQGKSALVSNPESDPRHIKQLQQKLDFAVRNILAVPLGASGDMIGALELLNKRGGPFGPNDEKLATLIAVQAHSALVTWRQREEREKENRLEAIGQMLSGVIHDFRTPMTIVSGYVQLMAVETDGNRRAQQAETILRQIDFINNMTRELLAFARGESGLLLHKIYTNNFFEQIREVLEKELEQSSVELKLDDSYRGELRVDESKLRRLVFNLARNARQAMPGGGVFTISVEEAGSNVRLCFSDNGPGIPESIRDRLFESFVTEGKQDGTGLGLAVVKRIVEEHGGTIQVESSPGSGATFRVELPKRFIVSGN